MQDFDFVVIGAGPAGEAAAHKARELGASVAVVDWVTLVVGFVAAAAVGAGGRTVVPATAGREVGLGRATDVRSVVLGLGGAAAWLATADDGTAVTTGGAVTELSVASGSSVENKKRSAVVVVEDVVDDAASNWRALGGPEFEQPTRAIAAAKSPSGRKITRGITLDYSPLAPGLPLEASWTSRHQASRR